MPDFVIDTERLRLRPFEERDLQAFVAYRSDAEVSRYQGWALPYGMEQAREFLAEMQAAHPGVVGEWYQWAVELRSGRHIIGDVALHVEREDPRQAEIGVTFAVASQGQGYALEALRALLAYAFPTLKLHRVVAKIDPRNSPAAHSLQRLGFRHEGHFVQNYWDRDQWTDEDLYAILASEWSV